MISRLFGRPRMWAWRRLNSGKFGPVIPIDGVLHVTAPGDEHYAGHPFSPEQLAAVGALHIEPAEEFNG
jgi:hypothetical protein